MKMNFATLKRIFQLAFVLAGAAALAPAPVQAQIAFRSAASASALPPTFRAASSMSLGVTFVAAASATTTGATLTIARPGAAVLDDVLIASIAVRPNTTAITAPAGWALIRTDTSTSAAPVNEIMATYRKVAGASEPASYSWTFSGTPGGAAGGILAFRGVDTATPIDIQGGQEVIGIVNTTSFPVPTPDVTTTVANAMLVTAHSITSSGTAGSTWTPPTGMTEAVDRASGSGTGGESIGINFAIQATAGATGTKTATASGHDGDRGVAQIIALRPAAAPALRINVPAGTVANDVMIASIGFRPSTTTITPPAGWTLVRRIDNAAANSNSLAVYSRVAGAAEPAFYDWSFTGVSFAVGGIQGFFDIDTASPIDVENGQTTPSLLTHATPSVTTTVANAMVVTSHTYASSRSWTPPTGMTESFDRRSGVLAAVGQAIEGNRALQAAAGATGARTATAAADADVGNTHILALRPATPALTIAVPAGTVANDVMVAAVGIRPSTAAITAPAGWTLVQRTDNALATANSLAVYIRVAGAAEPASYTWGVSGFTRVVGGIQSFSGADTTTPIDVFGGAATASALTHATPSVVTTVANTMLVTAHTFSSIATWTPPTGMTEAYDRASLARPGPGGQAIEGSFQPQAAAGATGTRTATASADADVGNAHILALRPVVTVPPPGSFNAFETSTAAGAITGVIKTRIAGAVFSLDVVAIASGAQLAGFTDAVIVELLGNNTLGVPLDAQNCPTSFTLVQTVTPNPTITGGRSTVSFAAVPNSFRDVRVRVRWPTTSPTVTSCSTDNFAIRPNAFANFSVTDTDSQTPGTLRTLNEVIFGALTHKAGRAFTVRADAVNAAGVPAITTNYAGTATPTLSVCVGAACTASFGTFTVGAAFALGQLNSSAATYGEVGSFALQLVDSTFASVDNLDSTALEREITSGAAINVGRFVPDHFAVSLNTPAFGTACGAGGFTYIGQAFNYTAQPVITVTAENFANGTTTLYAGAWWRITNASLTGKAYTAATGTLDSSGITGTDPVIAVAGSGMGTLTFSSGTGLLFTRTTPFAPFNADISLAINVIDADGVILASNPARFGTATAGNGIAFSSGKPMRFGRLTLRNANGSQLVPLPVLMEAQHWNGTAFITNTADSCTSIAAGNVAMSNFTQNLAACETAISGGGVLSSGRRTLLFAAPGSANNGSADLTVNLGASATGNTCTAVGAGPGPLTTTANLPYLQGNWTGINYDQNPSARATFGVFPGSEEVIFIRENF